MSWKRHSWLLLALLSGCAHERPTLSSTSPGLVGTNAFPVWFGTASLDTNAAPATFSFQKAQGKLGSAKEGFRDAAEIAVTGPATLVVVPGRLLSDWSPPMDEAVDPYTAAVILGAAGVVTSVGAAFIAPATATKGLIRSWKKLSPEQLAGCETNLVQALKNAAAQRHFDEMLLATAAQRAPGRLLGDVGSSQPIADAVLDARIEDLLLERAGSDEGSYFLRIKARARLARVADGVILYDQQFEYRSGQCLFLDWTLEGAVRGVTETGYRALAEYIIGRIFTR